MDKSWKDNFDERQLREIEFARVYSSQFGHGTPGHMDYEIITKLADMLDEKERRDE